MGVRLAEKACKLTNREDPRALNVLAAAYAEIGRFKKAIETAEQAADLAATSGNEVQAADIRERLKLYIEKHPYREKSGKLDRR